MSSKLEELRRRFQSQYSRGESPLQPPVAAAEPTGSVETGAPTVRPGLSGQGGRISAMVEAVTRIFDQTRGFKPAFDELVAAVEVLDRLGETTARAFGPLQSFQANLVYLVACFEPVQAFQENLRQLTQNFAPARPLHEEMTRLSESLQSEIATLVKMLEPAREFRERLLALARAFNQVDELLDELAELQSALAAARPRASDPGQPDDLVKAVAEGVVRRDFGDEPGARS